MSPSDTDRNGDPSDTIPATEPTSDRSAPRLSLPSYEVGDAIGKGGMGEVLIARDPKIGRDVAIKRMAASAPSEDDVSRFLREARIQARLEHPAIVPVYEVGHDANDRPYFTMKRLAGTTLQQRLAHARLQELLRAFVDVCLAVDFAHSRRVVHRDLKPANIMLGDYGEVYVLDWGVARVLTDEGEVPPIGAGVSTLDGQTQLGAMLGTPGYIAPEQVRGEDVGSAADIYSLGCILFEILAGEPLHRGGHAAIATTLSDPTQAPAQRRRDRAIAPELDAICVAALAADAAARPSARALADRVQQFLDGDRDLARRRELAGEELAFAHAAAADPIRRGEAMRSAGRALALDPESEQAAAMVTRLILEPPAALPAELEQQLDRFDQDMSIESARVGSLILLFILATVPFVLLAGVRDMPLLVAIIGYVIGLVLYTRYQVRIGRTNDIAALVLSAGLVAMVGRVLGPFILAPSMICVIVIAIGQQSRLVERTALVVGVALAAFLAPIVLEATGVLPSTWALGDDRIVMSSQLMHLGSWPTLFFLIVPHVIVIVVVGMLNRSIVASRRTAQRALEIRAWHLRHLLPT